MARKSWLRVKSIGTFGSSFDGACVKLTRRGGRWTCEPSKKTPRSTKRGTPRKEK